MRDAKLPGSRSPRSSLRRGPVGGQNKGSQFGGVTWFDSVATIRVARMRTSPQYEQIYLEKPPPTALARCIPTGPLVFAASTLHKCIIAAPGIPAIQAKDL